MQGSLASTAEDNLQTLARDMQNLQSHSITDSGPAAAFGGPNLDQGGGDQQGIDLLEGEP